MIPPSKLAVTSSAMFATAERIKDSILGTESTLAQQYAGSLATHLAGLRTALGYEEVVERGNPARVIDTRVESAMDLVSPQAVEIALPLSRAAIATTEMARNEAGQILSGKDDRLMVVVGPCSIHDPDAALEYAEFIRSARTKHGEDMQLVMRAYDAKPRTELGWKGFVSDPRLDGSDDMNLGVILDRMLALRLTSSGVPLARERLNFETPAYVMGLITYDAIGARNAHDQNARVYASGTSSIVGIKHDTHGDIGSAVSACVAANGRHSRIRTAGFGRREIVTTTGNRLAHVILRGGGSGPNFESDSVDDAVRLLHEKNRKLGLRMPEGVVIDISHANKIDGRQMPGCESAARQVAGGSRNIFGVMIESHLKPGNQKLDPAHPEKLEYGISITDACVGLEETSEMLDMLAAAVRQRRGGRV